MAIERMPPLRPGPLSPGCYPHRLRQIEAHESDHPRTLIGPFQGGRLSIR